MFKQSYKRAISPIVATALLLIVAVLSITGFQTWYTGYQSSTLANVEQQSQTSSIINVEGIVGDTLYLKSGSEAALSILKIADSNGNTMCEINDGVESDLQADTRLLLNFNDGMATDLSGYGNNGTLNGATISINDCISGSCFEFDGVGNKITTISSQALNFQNKSFTYSIWIKVNESTDYRVHTGDIINGWNKFGFSIDGNLHRFMMSNISGPDVAINCI